MKKIYYPIRKIWIKELEQLPFTKNENYIRTLKEIPKHFESENLFFCMMLAFNFGEQRGRSCERDLIKNNSLATFQWLKFYFNENGCLPNSLNELWIWKKEFAKELEND